MVSAPIVNGVIAKNFAESHQRRVPWAVLLAVLVPILGPLVTVGAVLLPVEWLQGISNPSEAVSWAIGLTGLVLGLGLTYLLTAYVAASVGLRRKGLLWTVLLIVLYGAAFSFELAAGGMLLSLLGSLYLVIAPLSIGAVAAGAYAWLRSERASRARWGTDKPVSELGPDSQW